MKFISRTVEEFIEDLQLLNSPVGSGMPEVWCDIKQGINADLSSATWFRYGFAYHDQNGNVVECREIVEWLAGESQVMKKLGLQLPPPGVKLVRA